MLYQTQHFGVSEYFCKETGADFSFPLHMHHSFEFITVLEGHMTVTVGEVRYELEAGEGILLFPEQIHALRSDHSRHLLLIFPPDLVHTYDMRHASELPVCNKLPVPPYLRTLLEELDGSASVIKIKAVLYALCAILDEHTAYGKKKAGERGLLHAIFDFVEKQYDKECTLRHLSAALGYNGSYLSRYFGETTGMAFLSYVHRYRIGKATALLRDTDKTVLACAYECGYDSLRSFNRNFKSVMGQTPKEFRTRAAEGTERGPQG